MSPLSRAVCVLAGLTSALTAIGCALDARPEIGAFAVAASLWFAIRLFRDDIQRDRRDRPDE